MKQDLIYVLITYNNGRYSNWIEIAPKYFNTLKAMLMSKPKGEFIAILDRRNTYPLLVRMSEIQSVEVDIPDEDELKEAK